MHFQSLLVLHGLQKKSKGITPWPGKQGPVHHRLLGAQSCAEPQPWYSTAKPTQQLHTDLSSHLLRVTPPHFPHGRMQGKESLCHHHGDTAPTDSQGRKSQAQHIPSTAVPCHSLPPQQYIIHLSDISPANLAKQECFSFNTSRTRELSGEKLVINSPLLFAVVIYSQEG